MTERVEVMQARVRTLCRGGDEVKFEKGEVFFLIDKTDNDRWKVRYIILVHSERFCNIF